MVTSETGLRSLSREGFAGYVGDRFRVVDESAGLLELELTEAQPLPISPSIEGRPEPFVLLFRGPGAPVLAQRTVRFEHQVLGSLSLFIVPIMPDAEGPRYEAIFN